MKIGKNFANKEISAFRFCENLERIVSQSQALNITDNKTFGKAVKSILLKKKNQYSEDYIALTKMIFANTQ